MANAHDIAGEIMAFLKSRRPKSAQQLGDLARAYGSLCERVNVRLSRCADYLRRGLRAEAVYQAEIEPDLLDQVGALDLAGKEDWVVVCREQELQLPPALALDVAQELNSAYADLDPMRPLLGRLRLLSLAHGPVRERLDVLRALKKLDPNGLLWDEDIKEFERARLNEIPVGARDAAVREDRKHLGELLKEVAGEPWTVPVPVKLQTALSGAARKLQEHHAVGELKGLLSKLVNAHSAMDYDEVCMLLGRWAEIVQHDELKIPADLQAQVQPVLDWAHGVDRQRRHEHDFHRAVGELTVALESGASTQDLHKLYQQVESYEERVDPDLRQRYEVEIDRREMVQRQRTRFQMALVGVVVVGLGVASFTVLSRSRETTQVSEAITRLNVSIDEQRWPDAQKFRAEQDKANPTWVTRPDWSAAAARLDEAWNNELLRRDKFRKTLEGLKGEFASLQSDSNKATLTKAGVFDGSEVDSLVLRAAESAKKSESLAQNSAMTPEERAEVEVLRKAFKEQRDENQRLLDEAAREAIEAQDAKVEGLDPELLRVDPPRFRQILNEREQDLVSLKNLRSLTSGLASRVQFLDSRLDNWKKKDRDAEDRKRTLEDENKEVEALVQHTDSAAKLAAALRRLATKYPDSPRSAVFTEAANHEKVWESVLEWSKLAELVANDNLPADSSELDGFIQKVNDYLQANPSSPFQGAVTAYRNLLLQHQQSIAAESSWREQTNKLFTHALISKLYSLDVEIVGQPSKRYYQLPGPKISAESYSAKVLRTPDISKHEHFAPGGMGKLSKPVQSPQSRLAEDILNQVVSRKQAQGWNWEIDVLEIGELIRTRTDVDALIRGKLLCGVLEAAKLHLVNSVREASEIVTKLQAVEADKSWNWMNPDDTEANRRRQGVDKVLDECSGMPKLVAQLKDKRQKVVKDARLRCRGSGVLLRRDGKWDAQTKVSNLTDGCRFMILVDRAGSSGCDWSEIGSYRDGKPILDDRGLGDAPEGTMFFIVAPPES